MTIYYFDSDT